MFTQTRQFAATDSAFVAMRAFLDGVTAQAGWAKADTHRLTLILEEIFTNTVKYGAAQAAGDAVTLTLTLGDDGRIAVDYRDCAPPHNPFERLSLDHLSEDTNTRRIGGLGVPLILALAEDVRHAHADRGNRITFTLRPRAPNR